MTSGQQEMIEYTTQEVARYIIEDKKVSIEEALECFYTSQTFKKLEDVSTGLYLEGSVYLYDMLQKEIRKR